MSPVTNPHEDSIWQRLAASLIRLLGRLRKR